MANKKSPRLGNRGLFLLVESSDGELMLVEMQNESQVDYLQRMIHEVSKLKTEYIREGEP